MDIEVEFEEDDVRRFPDGEPVTPEDMALVGKAAAAAYLGVSERTLDRYVREYGAPCHRLGGRVWFRRVELAAWSAMC